MQQGGERYLKGEKLGAVLEKKEVPSHLEGQILDYKAERDLLQPWKLAPKLESKERSLEILPVLRSQATLKEIFWSQNQNIEKPVVKLIK